MQLDEAKKKFINEWGILSSDWGIPKSMAQVHALLLVNTELLSCEDIMEALQISRGNANMTTRELINWGLVKRETKSGERREFFKAEKDMWKVFIRIVKERRKRELEPIIHLLYDLEKVEGDKRCADVKEFTDMIHGIHDVSKKADKLLETLVKSDENWFMKMFFKIVN